MADVVYDGTGAPILAPPIVVLEGVGEPVATANEPPENPVRFNNKSPIVSLGADDAIFNNATSPTEEEFGGVGEPVADGNQPGFPQRFDNESKDATLGAPNAIFDNANSPTEEFIGTAGIPVGDGNRADYPVNGFDNKGKNVVVVPEAGRPVGTELWKEVELFSPPLNFDY